MYVLHVTEECDYWDDAAKGILLRSDVDLLETCRIGKLWGRAIYQ